uniref:Alpha-defensin N-terminal domain-containing protein n=1 Tax=Rhinolophus ferrumequinum TaxID=59479 RepID=A0A671FN37_RHIFE
MRTLALLAAALLLLALQANAKSLRETDDQVPAQDLQPGAKGQDVAISFGDKQKLIGTDNSLRGKGIKYIMTKGDSTLVNTQCNTQMMYCDCTLETKVILLTSHPNKLK